MTKTQRIYPHTQGHQLSQLYKQRWDSLQPTYDLRQYFGLAFISNVTWPRAWWCSPLANETSQL